MSYLVDLDFSSRDFETTRKSGLSLRKNSGRAENIPGEEEIRFVNLPTRCKIKRKTPNVVLLPQKIGEDDGFGRLELFW